MASTFRTVSLNTIYQLGAKLTNAISGFIIIGLISRQLGEDAVGVYTTVITYVSLYFIAVDYGANAYAVKAMTNTPKVFNKLLGQRLVISCIVLISAFFISLAIPPHIYTSEVKNGIFLCLAVIVIQSILASANAVFQYREKYGFQWLTYLTSATTHIALAMYFFNQSRSVNTILVAYTIASFIGGLTALLCVKRYTTSIIPMLDNTFNKKLAVETLPITISMVTNLLYFRIDALIMPAFRPLAEAGHYNVAYRLFENALAIPTFMGNALYPTLLRIKGTAQYATTLRKIIRTSLIIAIGTMLLTYAIAPIYVSLTLNQYQADTINYIRILALGLPFFFTTSFLMWLIITQGKQKHLIWIYFVNMLLSIGLNLFYIPKYGAYASAWITIILEAVVLLMSVYVIRK